MGRWLPYLTPSLLTYLSSNRPTYLPTQQPTYQHTNPSIYLPSHLPTRVPTYQHSYLPTYLHTYLPTYLPTYTYITLLRSFLSYPTLPFLVPIEVRFGMSWSLFRSVSVLTEVRFGSHRSPFRYFVGPSRSIPVRSSPFRFVRSVSVSRGTVPKLYGAYLKKTINQVKQLASGQVFCLKEERN